MEARVDYQIAHRPNQSCEILDCPKFSIKKSKLKPQNSRYLDIGIVNPVVIDNFEK